MEYLNLDLVDMAMYRKLNQKESARQNSLQRWRSFAEPLRATESLKDLNCNSSLLSSFPILSIHPDKDLKNSFNNMAECHSADYPPNSLRMSKQNSSHSTGQVPYAESRDKRSSSFMQTISEFGKKIKHILTTKDSNDSSDSEEGDRTLLSYCSKKSNIRRSNTPFSERPSAAYNLHQTPSAKCLSKLVVTNQLDPNSVPSYRKSVINLLKETDKCRMSVVTHMPPSSLASIPSGYSSNIDTERMPHDLNLADFTYDFRSQCKSSLLKSTTNAKMDHPPRPRLSYLCKQNSFSKSESKLTIFDYSSNITPVQDRLISNPEDDFSSVSGKKVFDRKKRIDELYSSHSNLDLDYKKIFSVIDRQIMNATSSFLEHCNKE